MHKYEPAVCIIQRGACLPRQVSMQVELGSDGAPRSLINHLIARGAPSISARRDATLRQSRPNWMVGKARGSQSRSVVWPGLLLDVLLDALQWRAAAAQEAVAATPKHWLAVKAPNMV